MRRVRAIMLKELREYGRNRSLVAAMALYPLIFTVQPLIAIFVAPSAAAAALSPESESALPPSLPRREVNSNSASSMSLSIIEGGFSRCRACIVSATSAAISKGPTARPF